MNLELVYSSRLIFFTIYGGFSLGAISTKGPGTFLQVSFNIGIKSSSFLEFISLEFLYFSLSYSNFFPLYTVFEKFELLDCVMVLHETIKVLH